jgi:CheY-like chemotaxis protein
MNAQPLTRILLVDDDESVRRSLGRHLRMHGYEVLEAGTGAVALQILTATLPALILMDIIVPGESFLATARCIKAEPRTAAIPIIALTATPAEAAYDRALFAAIVAKPCAARSLLDAIEAALDTA